MAFGVTFCAWVGRFSIRLCVRVLIFPSVVIIAIGVVFCGLCVGSAS